MTLPKGAVVGVTVAAAVLYAILWTGWTARWGWLDAVDSGTLSSAYRAGAGSDAWVGTWNAICTLFSPFVFRVVGLVVIVHALVRRRFRTAGFLFGTVELSGPLTEAAKWLAHRPRPDTAMVEAASSSFPSGHALGGLACVLALSLVAWPRLSEAVRPWWAVAAVLVVVAVGVGRVALNVHHASDVVAGWALATVWCALWLPLLPPVRAADGTPAAPGTAR